MKKQSELSKELEAANVIHTDEIRKLSGRIHKLENQMVVALCDHDPVPMEYMVGYNRFYHMECSKCRAHLNYLSYDEYVQAKLDLSLGDSVKWQKALDEIEKKKDGES